MAILAIFRSRRMAVLFLLGVSSGLPLYLTGQLLQAVLTEAGASIADISAMAIVGFGYTMKFCWAPLLDRYSLPFLGRRRGWALVSQLGLMVAIVAMGLTDPLSHPLLLGILAAAVAILSASQDVVLDAFSVDMLQPEERAAGSAIYMIGYRVAMLLTGTLGLFLGEFVPWSVIYSAIGLSMLIGVAATLMAEEPAAPANPPRTLVEAIYLPIVDLFQRYGKVAIAVLVFAAIYKFGDYFQQTLLITFFVRGLHFDFAEIALVYKLVAFAAIFIGGVAGGSMVAKYGLRRTLIVFGILDGVTSLLYSIAAIQGRDFTVFTISVFVHILTAQMGTAAFLAFLYSMCSKRVSATQMAVFTSLASIGQRVFGVFTGDVVAVFDGRGFGALVAHQATIEEVVRRGLDATVARLDFASIPVILDGRYRAWLAKLTGQTDAMVTGYNWPWFFEVTAMMAVPGILLAGFVARYARDKVAPSEPAP